MKVSVSLPDHDVEFLDEYARSAGFSSRSAVLHKAVHLLRMSELAGAYAEAWAGDPPEDDAGLWDTTVADGLVAE